MKQELVELNEEYVEDRIYIVRGQKVMLDFDLALIYGYSTKRFNEQVKNNIERFDEDFMFQLTYEELNEISRCKNSALNDSECSRSKNSTLNKKDGRGSNIKYLPHAFTEKVYLSGSSSKDSGKEITTIKELDNVELFNNLIKECLNNEGLVLK